MTRDAVVLGAGPAGCASATALARRGRSVLLLDRDPEPRFKIGESLLPWNTPILEELGLLPKIEAAGFQRKYGAFFANERTGGVRQVVFREAWNPARPSAWQVKRKDFDGLLAAHAADSGAEVRRGVTVQDVTFENGRATGVRVLGPAGAGEIGAKVVVDATGQAALLASRLKIRRQDSKLRKAALYAHFSGAWRAEGERGGDILLPFRPDVWYWVIPFSDGSASVGAVFAPSLLGTLSGKTNLERFEELLARSSKMREYLAGATRTSDVGSVSDYSFTATRYGGDGWVLAGDAATFLDPVFSTGVFLGMSAGVRAAKAIDEALSAKGRVDAADFDAYGRLTERMVARSCTATTTPSSRGCSARRRRSTRCARRSRPRSRATSRARRSPCGSSTGSR
jgi:flavin-dependent dehydrogenase